ncbi:glycoside hydrolase family 99-like domain-containing protein [Methylocystis parvus]|uniref:glycoside hydrolase family 99-like domain-containing protein n=1 Tax=Methylocystis parvus TaxID=134 RepID=UPI003C7171F8
MASLASHHDYELQDLYELLIRKNAVNAQHFEAVVGRPPLYGLELIDVYELASAADRQALIPFFDEEFYLRSAPVFEPGSSALNHFLRNGIEEQKSPHPLIDLSYISRVRSDIFPSERPVEALLTFLELNLGNPSPYFNINYYLSKAREVAGSALADYLLRGAARGIQPSPYFDYSHYRKQMPAGAPGDPFSCLKHFIEEGDAFGLAPSKAFDPEHYRSQRDDIKSSIVPPFKHFIMFGQIEGLSPISDGGQQRRVGLQPYLHPAPESPNAILSNYWQLKHRIKAAHQARLGAFEENPSLPYPAIDHEASLAEMSFPEHKSPELDIIIPFYNEFELTVECLWSLYKASDKVKFRIILVDDCSKDENCAKFKKIKGLVYTRNEMNLHYLRGCNGAYKRCSADFLLLLNNDTQLVDGSLDALMAVMKRNPKVGAAGPMVLYPNGRLQEAGCVLKADGTSELVGVGEDPSDPRYSFAREVDYVSGACLLVRRAAIGDTLYDTRYAPAYCEDADLSLRLHHDGWKIVYEPAARLYHHLSASTNKYTMGKKYVSIVRNQAALMAKWEETLASLNKVRCLAFYLPQFHPIEQNNFWWGAGFTEWTNVSKAEPVYPGHVQPHIPTDTGYYDLRLAETMAHQQSLANIYGVEGFVVYYYNFGGEPILSKPIDNLLKNPDIDFRFCYCWANENWTKHWNGGEKSILLEQKYDRDTLNALIDDAIRAAKDRRYLTLKGMPLFGVYRPLLIPDVKSVAAMIRKRFKKAGFAGVQLMYVESMEAVSKKLNPADIGFDFAVEFPPQGIAEPVKKGVVKTRPDWDGALYDYAGSVVNSCNRDGVGYKRFPCVFPSWDNTARQPKTGTILYDPSPERFQAAVEAKCRRLHYELPPGERLLFVNAWNEWAEGAHLEPDRAYGHRWLSALQTGMSIAQFAEQSDD